MSFAMRFSPLVLIGAVLTSCATFTASPSEYEAYRRVRVAESVETRLTQSADYLRAHPKGRYQAEVRGWFNRAEPKYFAQARGSKAGLIRYLNQLPDGPHAADATERLAELELAEAHERRRAAELTEQGVALEEKLSDADRMRAKVVSTFSDWVRSLATLPSWGVRTHELPHEFIYQYRMLEPSGTCSADRCIKPVSLPYAIPDGGRLRARRALFDVVLNLREGGLRGARIAGPELFNRLAEAENLRPVRPNAALARAESIATATTVVAAALEPSLPERDCASPAVAPIVLVRHCKGIRVEVYASDTAEADDAIVFSPSP